jgi:hypothetical protein
MHTARRIDVFTEIVMVHRFVAGVLIFLTYSIGGVSCNSKAVVWIIISVPFYPVLDKRMNLDISF